MSHCLLLFSLLGTQAPGAGDQAGAPLLKLANALGTPNYTQMATIDSAAFSRSSYLLATGAADATVRIWDTKKNIAVASVRRPPPHDDPAFLSFEGRITYAALFGADKFLLACDHEGPFCWDLINNRPVFNNTPALSRVKATAIVITPDEKAFWIGDKNGVLLLYSTADGGFVYGPLKNGDQIECLAVSPDGLLVPAGLTNGKIALWNTKTGKLSYSVEAHEGAVARLQFAEKGSLLVSAGHDAQLHVWAANSMQRKASINASEKYVNLTALAVSPKGTLLALSTTEGGVALWDIAEQKKVRDLSMHSFIFNDISFSPDGEMLAAVNYTVCLWETRTGKLLNPRLGHYGAVQTAAVSNDARKVFSAAGDRRALCWPKGAAMPHEFAGFKPPRYTLSISMNSSTLAVATDSSTVDLWDLQKETKTRSIDLAKFNATSIKLSPDGQKFAIRGLESLDQKPGKTKRLLQIYDAGSGKFVRAIDEKPRARCNPCFAPNNAILLLRDGDGVKLLDSSTGETIGEAVDPSTYLLAAFSPDGSWFAASNRLQQLTIWDTKTCTRIRSLGEKIKAHSFRSVAVAPNGKRIAAGGLDGTISLWDPAGNELFKIKHHEGAVTCLAFSPDGNFLVSGSADTTLAVWEVKKE